MLARQARDIAGCLPACGLGLGMGAGVRRYQILHATMRLGGNHNLIAPQALVANGVTQHLLRQTIGIDIGGIKEIHSRIKGLAHKRASLILILAANHSPKPIATKGHGAKAKFGNDKACPAQGLIFHRVLPRLLLIWLA